MTTTAHPSADGPQTGAIGAFEARRPEVDRAIAAAADAQHGLITVSQLHEAGLSTTAVQKRALAGRLHRIYAGVYSVGHRPLDLDSEKMAVVLACGPLAVLSHGSAAALWRLRAEAGHPFDVIAPNRRGRIPGGIRAHRDGTLQPDERTTMRGIPCTTVARTLLDLAGKSHIYDLERVIAEAEVLRILDLDALHAVIDRNRGRRGVARLRLLASKLSPQTGKSRSWLERQFLNMCERGGIPQPEVNSILIVGSEDVSPDFLWREARLIIETDGRETHDTASAFEADRLRDQSLSVAGWQVVRFTWRQILKEPSRVARTIHTLLNRRASNRSYRRV